MAFALLITISTFLLVNLSESYNILSKVKGVTSSTTATMGIAEREIQNVKDAQEAGDVSGYLEGNYTLFTGAIDPGNITTVKGYPLFVAGIDSGMDIFAIVGEQNLPDLPVPIIDELKVWITNQVYEDSSYFDPNIAIYSDTTISDPDSVYLKTIYQWYVSREGFYTKEYLDADTSLGMVPGFPGDYELIPGATAFTFNSVIEAYKGRHIVLTAIPAASSGKMGSRTVSESVYISGLPSVSSASLVAHFDMGLFDSDGMDVLDKSLESWNNYKNIASNAVQAGTGKQPILNTTTVGIGDDAYRLYTALFDGSNDEMSASFSPSFSNQGITVFAAARKISPSYSMGILNGNSWTLNSDGFSYGGIKANSSILGSDTDWHVLGARVTPDTNGYGDPVKRVTCTTDLGVPDVVTTGVNGSSISTNSITIGCSPAGYFSGEISEVIVYNGSLSDEEYNKVLQYLANKYSI